jgi:hypothetical protein
VVREENGLFHGGRPGESEYLSWEILSKNPDPKYYYKEVKRLKVKLGKCKTKENLGKLTKRN